MYQNGDGQNSALYNAILLTVQYLIYYCEVANIEGKQKQIEIAQTIPTAATKLRSI